MKKTLLLLFAALMGGVNVANAEDLMLGIGWNASLPSITSAMTYKMSQYAEVGVTFDTPLTRSDYKKVVFTFAEPLSIPAWGSGIKYYGDVSTGLWAMSLNTGETTYELIFDDLEITDTKINALTFMHSQEAQQVVKISKITLVKTDDTEEDYVAKPYTNWGVTPYLSNGSISFSGQYGTCEILTSDLAEMTHAATDAISYKYTITFSEAIPTTLFFELDNSENSGFGWKNISAGATSYSFEINPSELSQDCAHICLKSNAESGYPYTVKISSITREAFVPITFPSDKTLISYSPSTGTQLDVTDVDGLKAYVVGGVTATSVKLTETKGIYGANLGYILEGTAGATYNIPVVDDALNNGGNKLSGTGDGAETVSAYSVYVLSDGKFCLFTGTEIPAHKAYLPASYVPTEGHELTLVFGDDDATAIKNIKVGTEDNVYYDLQGRRVLYPTKGLYIVNGKKVIVK